MTHRASLLGRAVRLLCVLFFLACLLSLTAAAQSPNDLNGLGSFGDRIALLNTYSTAPGTGVVLLQVFAERDGDNLDRQAVLKLVNRNSQDTVWSTTDDRAQGVFTNILFGNYDLDVNAVGYLGTHQELQINNSLRAAQIAIVLHRDPEAVNLDVGGAVLSPKARKQTKLAVSDLKSGNLKQAQKHLDEAYRMTPSSPDLNFLLGYLYFQRSDFAQAEIYLGKATSLNPHNAQALTLLGRTGLERQDYPAARSALEQAVLADAENWLPHNLLATAYLYQKDYGKARDEAQVAITKGKSTANSAQLVLGQALVGLGQDQEGIQALNNFLKQSPQHAMAGQVRTLIAQLQERKSGSVVAENTPGSSLTRVDPLAALPAPGLSTKQWKPPGIDDVKPSIAPGVVCPSDQVIEESGKRAQELVEDVERFAAVEDLLHQSLDQFGIPTRTETRKYNYVASISQPQPGFLEVDEFRADKFNLSEYPDQIASNGFVALALVFHPVMRENFEMSCEGLGDWRGQATWLVHFRQRDDRPNRMHSYKVGSQMYSVPLKGRAWITPDKFQIVRMEAEMVNPMPEIQLLSEHQTVDYGPVPFLKKNTSLWLPKSAEIYFDFRKHRYYRRHSFDHYMLYSVDSEEKPKEPVVKPDQGDK
ncbi:MAG: tetratricopeptide repeat protein [Candidatus Sulfotelmatobacter sp.]